MSVSPFSITAKTILEMQLTELVKTTTRDGIRLDGAYWRSNDAAKANIDAVIMLHGVGGNFYGGALFEPLSERLLAQGVSVLRVNTRGRDGVFAASTPGGRRELGSAYEIVDDCRLDIAAWIDWLHAQGDSRIGLVGHSLGAIKAIYSQANEPDERIVFLAALSPPMLSYELFANSSKQGPFLSSMEQAQQLAAAGQGDQLFQARFPFPMLIAAGAYVDKYGPKERYNVVRYVDRLQAPSLIMHGQVELESGGPAFAQLPDSIRQLDALPETIDLQELPDADHFYTGVRVEAAQMVMRWLRKRFAQ